MRNMLRGKGESRSIPVGSAALVAVVLLSACGLGDTARQAVDDAASQAEEAVGGLSADAAAATVGAAVQRTLQEAGYALTVPPKCSAELSADGQRLGLSGEVTCSGETASGEAYEGVFDGLVTLTGRCPGSLRVEIMGDSKVNVDQVDVCRVARLLEGG